MVNKSASSTKSGPSTMSTRAPWRILLLNTKPRNPNYYMAFGILDGFRASQNVEDVVLATYGNAIDLAREHRSNLFVAWDGEEINLHLCAKLASLCGTSVLWLTDDPYEHGANVTISNSGIFDLVFTNDLGSLGGYRDLGRHLPFAANPELNDFPVSADGDMLYDVCFIGAAWPNRVRLLRSLLRDLDGLRFKVALHWNEHLPAIDLPLPESSYRYAVSPKEFSRIANRSRVTLGLHRFFATSHAGNPLATTPPPRIFEAALAGANQIFDGSLSEITRYFTPNKEISLFHSYAECVNLIRRGVTDSEFRRTLASNARQRALQDHLYKHRAAELLRQVSAIAPASANGAARPAIVSAARSSPAEPRKNRPRVLFVSHNVTAHGNYGGVEVYIDGMRRQLGAYYEILVYALDQTTANGYALFDEAGRQIEHALFNNRYQRTCISNAAKEEYFSEILNAFSIDLVHFHHLIGHPLTLPVIARAHGVATVATFQDFWAVCDSFNLLDDRNRYCDVSNRDKSICELCTERRIAAPMDMQMIRRGHMRRSLKAVDRLIFNTRSTLDIFAAIYPELHGAGNVSVLPLPLLDPSVPSSRDQSRSRLPISERAADDPIVVALIGNFTTQKGAESFVMAASGLRDAPILFKVYGRIEPHFADVLEALKLSNVEVPGPYSLSDIPRILREADMTCHLSIWPETYCIALSEAWAYRCIPVVTKLGALGERVVDGVNGFVVSPDDAHELAARFRWIASHRDVLDEMRKNIDPTLWVTEAAHAAVLKGWYDECLLRHDGPVPAGAHLPNSRYLSYFDCGYTRNEKTATSVERTDEDATSLTKLESTRNRRGTLQATVFKLSRGALPVVPGSLTFDDFLGERPRSFDAKRIGETIRLRGWALVNGNQVLKEPKLALRRRGEATYYCADVVVENRPDVARAFGNEQALASGFQTETPLTGIEPGTYDIYLTDETVSLAPAQPMQLLLESDVVDLPGTYASDVDAAFKIDDVNGSGKSPAGLKLRQTEAFAVRGWAFAHAAPHARPFISFDNVADGSRTVITTAAVHRPDVAEALNDERARHSGFIGAILAARLQRGLYRVSLVFQVGRSLQATRSFAEIEVLDK